MDAHQPPHFDDDAIPTGSFRVFDTALRPLRIGRKLALATLFFVHLTQAAPLDWNSNGHADAWARISSFNGANDPAQLFADSTNAAVPYFCVSIEDMDSDGDQVSDYEEQSLGFDPTRDR